MTTSERETGWGVRERLPEGAAVSMSEDARLQSAEEDHASRAKALHLRDKRHDPEESRGQQEKGQEIVMQGGVGVLSTRARGLGLAQPWGPDHSGRTGLPMSGPRDTCPQLEAGFSRAERSKPPGRGGRTRSRWPGRVPAEAALSAPPRARRTGGRGSRVARGAS